MGEVVAVDPSAVEDLLAAGRIPVVSTVAPDLDSDAAVLNVNADTAAAALAVALGARKLVVLTDVEGVYSNWPNRHSLLSKLSATAARDLRSRVDAGMIPKLEACIAAVDGGVPQAHVIDGRKAHSLLLEVFTSEGIGTMVLPDEPEPDEPGPDEPVLDEREPDEPGPEASGPEGAGPAGEAEAAS